MKITVICVGKIKEQYWKAAIMEYSKRLQSYCKLEIIEVADEKTPDNASDGLVLQIKQKEGARIRRYINDGTYVIALAIEGNSLDSVGFSKKIEQLGVQGKSHIVFLIGGSLGLDDMLLKDVDYKLSFSEMTFPHQLMRVILLEQLYRGYRIANHQPYHK